MIIIRNMLKCGQTLEWKILMYTTIYESFGFYIRYLRSAGPHNGIKYI